MGKLETNQWWKLDFNSLIWGDKIKKTKPRTQILKILIRNQKYHPDFITLKAKETKQNK